MTEPPAPVDTLAETAATARFKGAYGHGTLLLAGTTIFAYLAVMALNPVFDGDEFIFAMDARRVAEGQIQARDFFQYLMPGWLLITGAVFKLTGPSLYVARLVMAAFVALMAVLYLRLGRAVGAGTPVAWSLALASPFLLCTTAFYFGHRMFAQAMLALALWLAWRAIERGGDRPWLWAGLGAGLTYATHQQDGAVAIAGVGAGALWLAWHERWGHAATVRRAGLFLAGAALPLLALATWFAVHGALGEMLWATHVWPFTQYKAAGNHNDVAWTTDLGPLISPMPWVSRPFYYARLLMLEVAAFLPFAAPLVGLAWLAGQGRGQPLTPSTRFLALLVGVCAFGFLAAMRARADVSHLMGGMFPALLLVVAGSTAWARLMAAPAARGLRYLPHLALVAFVATGPAVAVELIRRDPTRLPSLATPDARLRAHPTMQALARRLAPGDTLFASAHGGMYNFYLAPNPTRYDYWVRPEDGYTTPAQHAELVADVLAKRPRLLVVPARSRAAADALVAEMLGAYAFAEALPHVGGSWRVRFEIYVYECRPR